MVSIDITSTITSSLSSRLNLTAYKKNNGPALKPIYGSHAFLSIDPTTTGITRTLQALGAIPTQTTLNVQSVHRPTVFDGIYESFLEVGAFVGQEF